jgi:tRNA G26 N,N-dimethylase Trm1
LIKSKQMELKTSKKLYGMLHAIVAEKELSNRPLGFNIELVSKSIQSSTPDKVSLMSAF